MRRTPWFVMNHLLCLEKWKPNTSVEEIAFNKSPFWIQIHHLPLENLSVANAEKLLKKVGEVLEIENPILEARIRRHFIRGRVLMDLDKPFCYWLLDP